MIKRLKWNVLYGGDSGNELGSESDSDSELDADARRELLDQLLQNDFLLRDGSPEESADGDGDATSNNIAVADSAAEKELRRSKVGEDGGVVAQSVDVKGNSSSELKRFIVKKGPKLHSCEICQKVLLNLNDLENHLQSKKHRAALESIAHLSSKSKSTDASALKQTGNKDDEAAENDNQKEKQRRQAVKKKLKRLKERQWRRREEQTTEQDSATQRDSKAVQHTNMAPISAKPSIERNGATPRSARKRQKSDGRMLQMLKDTKGSTFKSAASNERKNADVRAGSRLSNDNERPNGTKRKRPYEHGLGVDGDSLTDVRSRARRKKKFKSTIKK